MPVKLIKSKYIKNVHPSETPLGIYKDADTKDLRVFDEKGNIESINAITIPGPQGPQGVAGPQGPIGLTGASGITWRGAWSNSTAYNANDAVFHNSSSYFIPNSIAAGQTAPGAGGSAWFPLALQGAQGAAGAQGPTGPQGLTGPSGASSSVVKYVKRTITSSQLLNLNTSSVSILANTDPSVVVRPIFAYYIQQSGTAYNYAGTVLTISTDAAGSVVVGTISAAPFKNSDGGYAASSITTSTSFVGVTGFNTYRLLATGSNPTDGTGNMDFYLAYIELPL